MMNIEDVKKQLTETQLMRNGRPALYEHNHFMLTEVIAQYLVDEADRIEEGKVEEEEIKVKVDVFRCNEKAFVIDKNREFVPLKYGSRAFVIDEDDSEEEEDQSYDGFICTQEDVSVMGLP